MKSLRSGSRYEYGVIAFSIALVLAMGFLLRGLEKDTSLDAFMRADHPALALREQVKATFGLRDPIIVALIDDTEGGVFDVESLNLLHWLTERIRHTPNVDPDRVVSLATASKIIGDGDSLVVESFYDSPLTSQAQADEIAAAVGQMPAYQGTLVAQNGRGAIISIELLDADRASETYKDVLALTAAAPSGGALFVAGEAAVSGYLSEYLNRDSRKLVPIGFLAVFVIIFLAFRTWASIVSSLIVVAASVVSALGFMAALGVPYFVITNALPSILIGVSVADSVHIMSAYYARRATDAKEDRSQAAQLALKSIRRPVILTTVTTVFGFSGIVISSSMPPMFWFGVFAIVGLAFALLYSMIFLPAALARMARAPSPSFEPNRSAGPVTGALVSVGRLSARKPKAVVIGAALLFVTCLAGAFNVAVDREQIGQFGSDEDIVRADRAINENFSGSNSLHVIVETHDDEGLLSAERLEKIDRLQAFALTLPHVEGATSIVDFIKQMNAAITGDASGYALPKDDDLIAQQHFLLTSGASPTEWEDEIDSSERMALIKLQLNSGLHSNNRLVVDILRAYIASEFNDAQMSAYLSGRINTDYHWLEPLAREHAVSIGVSLSLVLLAAIGLLRSLRRGLLAVTPVVLSIAVVYAVMGYAGIWLDAATSMFATIAIGLGVDFGIHAIERLEALLRRANASFATALDTFLETSGRALFFNFFSVFACFCVIASSELPTMQRFGGICALAILISFVASVTIIPAVYSLTESRRRSAEYLLRMQSHG